MSELDCEEAVRSVETAGGAPWICCDDDEEEFCMEGGDDVLLAETEIELATVAGQWLLVTEST